MEMSTKKFDPEAPQGPSQIPTNVTRASYNRMMKHARTYEGLWICRKNGARIKARMVLMNVWDRETTTVLNFDIPVVTLYCDGCDKTPNTHGGDAIYSDEIQTLAM